MVHWKKNKDLEDIKSAVNRKESGLEDMPTPREPPVKPKPIEPPKPRDYSSLPESRQLPSSPSIPHAPELVKSNAITKLEGQDDSAHIFIKVDRYDKILNKMDTLKDSIDGLAEIVSMMIDVDNIKRDVSGTLKGSLEELSKSLTALDGEFLRPEDVGDYEKKEDPKMIKLKEDIERLREQVSGF